jgi:di/tricarboxylate transporter
MQVEAWITIAVIGVLVAVMVRELIQPAVAMLAATMLLYLTGVISVEEALAGFSNEAPFVIAALLIFARAVDAAGIVQPVIELLFRGVRLPQAVMARLLFPIAGFSAFVNNTTVVAMTAPAVVEIAGRRRLPPSRYLMPVSFAAVLGGVITTIGTSTNLTVSGLLAEAEMERLGLFELTAVGLPIALAGCALMALLASWLLPDRGSARDDIAGEGRDFTVTMRVEPGGAVAGRSVQQAGLRHLQGVFLVEVDRGGRLIAPVAPDEVLEGEDLLTFVGRVDQIVDLQRMRGLASSENRQIDSLAKGSHAFFEIVLGAGDLVNRTLRQTDFRSRYGAAVLAIHRAGHRIDAKLGDVALHFGDTLLVLADPEFRNRWRDRSDFLIVAPLSGIPPTQPRKAWTVLLIGAAFVVLTTLGVLPIVAAAILTAMAVVATGTLTVRQAREAVDINLILLVASAFGLGTAFSASGVAPAFAESIAGVMEPFGAIGALAGVIVATMLVTELMSNNAAAVLMFPVSLATAAAVGADPRPFIIGVTLAASLSFLSPIGYQTNMIVYSLGGYRFTDFARLGIPLTILCVLLQIVLIPLVFPL